MRTSTKWTKWQVALIGAMLVVYLFQEVKESPEFLTAVRAAANVKLAATTVTSTQKTETPLTQRSDRNSSERINRRGNSPIQEPSRTEDSSPQTQTQTQTQTHTRSHAS
jgi:hypothetical protein